MNKFTAAAILILAPAVLIGCSEKSSQSSAADQPAGVIPQAQLDALNKAKNVENVMTEQANKTRAAADSE